MIRRRNSGITNRPEVLEIRLNLSAVTSFTPIGPAAIAAEPAADSFAAASGSPDNGSATGSTDAATAAVATTANDNLSVLLAASEQEETESPEFEAVEELFEEALLNGTTVAITADQVPLLDSVISHLSDDLLISERDLRALVSQTAAGRVIDHRMPSVDFDFAASLQDGAGNVAGPARLITRDADGQTSTAATDPDVDDAGKSDEEAGEDVQIDSTEAARDPGAEGGTSGSESDKSAATGSPSRLVDDCVESVVGDHADTDAVFAALNVGTPALTDLEVGIRYGSVPELLNEAISLPLHLPGHLASFDAGLPNTMQQSPSRRMAYVAFIVVGTALWSVGSAERRATAHRIVKQIRGRLF